MLTSVEKALLEAGATRVWIEPASDGGLPVMAEVPDLAVPTSQAPADC